MVQLYAPLYQPGVVRGRRRGEGGEGRGGGEKEEEERRRGGEKGKRRRRRRGGGGGEESGVQPQTEMIPGFQHQKLTNFPHLPTGLPPHNPQLL